MARKKKATRPEQPLANARHESFCRYVAAGGTLGSSWIRASVDAGTAVSNNVNAAKATGHKVSQHPQVAARIRYLKAERDRAAQRIDLPETVTKTDVGKLADECIVVLEETYNRCLNDPGATAPQRERLLQTLSQHLARTAKYTDDDAEIDDAEMAATARRVTDRLLTWPVCTCGGNHV